MIHTVTYINETTNLSFTVFIDNNDDVVDIHLYDLENGDFFGHITTDMMQVIMDEKGLSQKRESMIAACIPCDFTVEEEGNASDSW